MAAPGGGGENFDFCEYVYNPLMRQYQAMMRLMQMLRDSQNADCNDVQCFTDPNDPSNPMNALNRSQTTDPATFMVTYGPMLAMWAAVMLGLFLLRPASMRGGQPSSADEKRNKPVSGDATGSSRNRFPPNNDDDDSTIS
jgi:hypothetical protein